MLDASAVGLTLTRPAVMVEVGQLRLFAKATGQTDAIYVDAAAAIARGYRSVVAPPTFVHCLIAIGGDDPFELLTKLKVPLEDTLHGEQSFSYGALLCAGDCVSFEIRVADVYTRKQGTLVFLVAEIRATNQLGERVADIVNTTIVLAR
jgi:acyl dehydratase